MEKLVVKLSGGAKDAQSKREGIYKLALDIVNGKSNWIQEEGTSALWFDKTNENWKIGTKEPKRSSIAIYSNANVNQPQDAKIWNYWISGKETWIESNETEVYAGNKGPSI